MSTWLIIGIGAFLSFAIFVFWYFSKVRSLPVFYASYDYMIDQGASKQEALKSAISVFAERPPFDILDEDDILWLSKTFACLPNPKKTFGQILLHMDKSHDASKLKNREDLTMLIEGIKGKQEAGELL